MYGCLFPVIQTKPLKIHFVHRKNYNITFTLSLIFFCGVTDSEVAWSFFYECFPHLFHLLLSLPPFLKAGFRRLSSHCLFAHMLDLTEFKFSKISESAEHLKIAIISRFWQTLTFHSHVYHLQWKNTTEQL